MTRATFFADEAIIYPTAAGHTLVDQQAGLQRPWKLPRTANAAGGLVASVREMLAYASLWLNDGVAPSGERLLRPETLAQIESPQARLPDDLGTFGLGWGLFDGERHAAHRPRWGHGGPERAAVDRARSRCCGLRAVQRARRQRGARRGGWAGSSSTCWGSRSSAPATPAPLPRDAADARRARRRVQQPRRDDLHAAGARRRPGDGLPPGRSLFRLRGARHPARPDAAARVRVAHRWCSRRTRRGAGAGPSSRSRRSATGAVLGRTVLSSRGVALATWPVGGSVRRSPRAS